MPHPRYLLSVEGIDPELAGSYMCSGLTAYSALRKAVAHGQSGPVMIAALLPLGDRQNGTTGIGWRLPSAGLEVLGFWRDELLVHRAASTWLLSTDGEFLRYLERSK